PKTPPGPEPGRPRQDLPEAVSAVSTRRTTRCPPAVPCPRPGNSFAPPSVTESASSRCCPARQRLPGAAWSGPRRQRMGRPPPARNSWPRAPMSFWSTAFPNCPARRCRHWPASGRCHDSGRCANRRIGPSATNAPRARSTASIRPWHRRPPDVQLREQAGSLLAAPHGREQVTGQGGVDPRKAPPAVDKTDKPGERVVGSGDCELVDEVAVALLDRVEVPRPADHARQITSAVVFGYEDLRPVEYACLPEHSL